MGSRCPVHSSQSRCCLELHSCSPGRQPAAPDGGASLIGGMRRGGAQSKQRNKQGTVRHGRGGMKEREGKIRMRRRRKSED